MHGLRHSFALRTRISDRSSSADNNDSLIGHLEPWVDWGCRFTHVIVAPRSTTTTLMRVPQPTTVAIFQRTFFGTSKLRRRFRGQAAGNGAPCFKSAPRKRSLLRALPSLAENLVPVNDSYPK